MISELYTISFFIVGTLLAILVKKYLWIFFINVEHKILPVIAFILKFKKRKKTQFKNNITFEDNDI